MLKNIFPKKNKFACGIKKNVVFLNPKNMP